MASQTKNDLGMTFHKYNPQPSWLWHALRVWSLCTFSAGSSKSMGLFWRPLHMIRLNSEHSDLLLWDPRSGMTPKWGFGVAMLPVGASCFYQAPFGRTVLPKWPLWAHLFYSVFYSVSELRRACFRQARVARAVLPPSALFRAGALALPPIPHLGLSDLGTSYSFMRSDQEKGTQWTDAGRDWNFQSDLGGIGPHEFQGNPYGPIPSLRPKGTLISKPRFSAPCGMWFFPTRPDDHDHFEAHRLKMAIFPLSHGKNHMSRGAEIGAYCLVCLGPQGWFLVFVEILYGLKASSIVSPETGIGPWMALPNRCNQDCRA